MPMEQFFFLFPDLAQQETRVVHLRGHADLPDGEFGFIESYCNENNSDCRRVLINVMNPATGSKIWATINYGWESVEFYEKWIGNKKDAIQAAEATLDPFNPQTQYSPAFLRMFQWMLEDEAYVERLKRHYALFQQAIRQRREKTKMKRALQKRRPPKRKR